MSWRTCRFGLRSTSGDGSPGEQVEAPILLTEAEAADLLRVTPRMLENLRLGGRGPRYIRLAAEGVGKVVYILRDIEEWLSRFSVDTRD